MKLNKIHHVAVICSDYEKSKHFYTDVLGMKIVSENYREGFVFFSDPDGLPIELYEK